MARKILFVEKREVIQVLSPSSLTHTEALTARGQISFQILPQISKHQKVAETESVPQPNYVIAEKILPPSQRWLFSEIYHPGWPVP